MDYKFRSNRRIPVELQGAMSRFTGQIQTGLSGIVPYQQRQPVNILQAMFRNPVTGE